MPQQMVKDQPKEQVSCEATGCNKQSDVIVFDDYDLCSEHARELAEQLMKVTSKESTNVERNQG